MPYVDKGEPKPPTPLPPIVPYVAILLAMAAGVGMYWLTHTKLNGNQWLAPLVAGPLVGLAIRLTAKRPIPKQGLTAIVAALIACLTGYVYRHVGLIVWVDGFGNPLNPQPGVANAFEWLFSKDLMSFLLIGMSAYLAFAIGAAFPAYTPPPQPPSDQPQQPT